MAGSGFFRFHLAWIQRFGCRGLGFALLLLLGAPSLLAQDYPTRPVRMLIGAPAGTAPDFIARLLAPKFSEALKTPVVVENRPGANGTAATKLTAKSTPDGHTMHLAGIGALVIAPAMAKTPYDPLEKLAPVAQVVSMPNVLMVSTASPATGLDELIALAKKEPGRLTYAAVGNGIPGRYAGELFKAVAKVEIIPVQHQRGSDALNDLASGRLNFLVAATSTAVPQVKAGKARALAVTANKRLDALPDVPTVAEKGLAGYEATNWYGIVVPAGTPQRVIDRLHKETATILSTPATAKALAARGIEIAPSLPEQFSAYIRAERAKWTKVIKATQERTESRSALP